MSLASVRIITLASMLVFGFLAFLLLPGCKLFGGEAEVARAALYGKELDACVTESATLAESDACTCDVKVKWGRADAGSCPEMHR